MAVGDRKVTTTRVPGLVVSKVWEDAGPLRGLDRDGNKRRDWRLVEVRSKGRGQITIEWTDKVQKRDQKREFKRTNLKRESKLNLSNSDLEDIYNNASVRVAVGTDN